ncbi:DUF3558 domain-containing protein [Mycobacterium hodleri]|uniref:DUF3558 domain-containing protein n=1 Tax=Mycolicibacterium hodleri TaxID=49897 RepID=UPI0021F2C2C8|nr:DUF3558 domain-containing protein [Mycolicibacterium hodleri]MCV7131701.1 DUF3558 domain-containing protein [Mycolicibacterium hodleri]
MRAPTRRSATAAVAATAVVVVVAACSHTVAGVAERAHATVPNPDRSYGFVDDRCGLLHDEDLRKLQGAATMVKPFSGAVCQYVLSTDAGVVDVVFTWFERGSVDRERDVAAGRGARLQDKTVVRHPAFLAQRPSTPNACAATAAAGPGVLTWWVQFRQSLGDACADAETLLTATLSADS